jgi:hypothetical protein
MVFIIPFFTLKGGFRIYEIVKVTNDESNQITIAFIFSTFFAGLIFCE